MKTSSAAPGTLPVLQLSASPQLPLFGLIHRTVSRSVRSSSASNRNGEPVIFLRRCCLRLAAAVRGQKFKRSGRKRSFMARVLGREGIVAGSKRVLAALLAVDSVTASTASAQMSRHRDSILGLMGR